MKTIRACLLLLLAVAMPFRAAIGALPACVDAVAATVSSDASGNLRADGDADEALAADDAAAACDPGAHDRVHPGGRTGCPACDACCAASAPPAALPVIARPALLGDAAFPALSTPAASFVADAEHPPPRRC